MLVTLCHTSNEDTDKVKETFWFLADPGQARDCSTSVKKKIPHTGDTEFLDRCR